MNFYFIFIIICYQLNLYNHNISFYIYYSRCNLYTTSYRNWIMKLNLFYYKKKFCYLYLHIHKYIFKFFFFYIEYMKNIKHSTFVVFISTQPTKFKNLSHYKTTKCSPMGIPILGLH